MQLNLDRIAEIAEDLMLDECRILRHGRQEDTYETHWNEITGTYDQSRVPTWQVYRGKCMIYARRVDATSATEGGGPVSRIQYYASLPVDMDEQIHPEDEFQVLDCVDESLRNATFIIESSDQGTYRATREISMTRKLPGVT